MHRLSILLRKDQYDWLQQQKLPGKSISHYIRDLVDTKIKTKDYSEPSVIHSGDKNP